MLLDDARRIADEVVLEMVPMCERIEVAGSIRRRQADVKDIEIVYVSRMSPLPGQLFSVHEYPLTENVITKMIGSGLLRFDDEVRGNGRRYKRLVHVASSAVVELFRATLENWGVILALRTGPAEFNKRLVAHGWAGGILPPDMKIQDGAFWYRGVARATPEESDLFDAIGLPTWAPWDRHPGRLALWQQAQTRIQQFE